MGARHEREVSTIEDRVEPEVTDEVLGEEIELLGALMSAAAQAPEPLSDAEVDVVLGVPTEQPGGGPEGDRPTGPPG